jgi:hypothetical protein
MSGDVIWLLWVFTASFLPALVPCSKIATNLKVFGSCEGVVEQTLTLFQDLAAGYMSGKLLLKLEAIAFLLTHHTSGWLRAAFAVAVVLWRCYFSNQAPRVSIASSSLALFTYKLPCAA